MRITLLLCCLIVSYGCKEPQQPTTTGSAAMAAASDLSSQVIQRHLAELSDDKYEGRMPCMDGGIKAYKSLIFALMYLS